ncbi:MAG: adenylosuccinate lyase, partial [Alkalinema sp. RL_2_19]|nr:adenylosuccinate lyase [Alkalinema sp. RL_2_19]
DAFILTHFMLNETTDLVKNLLVHTQNMTRNMNLYGGVVFSQRVLLALVGKGMKREEAYAIVQTCAMSEWNVEGGNFRARIEEHPQVQSVLSAAEIADCFEAKHHLKNLDQVYQRLGI